MNPLEQKLRIRVNNFNVEHFKSIGYFPRLNDYIDIFVYELPVGSGTKIDVECNYCGNIFKKAYRKFLETQDDVCCENCKQEKMMKTSLRKYGNVCSLRNPDVLEKSKRTNQERLEVDFPFQNKSILSKCRETSIERYGEMFNSSSISKQQRQIHNVFGGKLNYSLFPYRLDILFEDEDIYFEYDGSGHFLSVKLGNESEEEFLYKETTREAFLYEKGYKQFRIKSETDIIPDDSELLEIKDRAFYILLDKNFNKYVYDLDNKTESFGY